MNRLRALWQIDLIRHPTLSLTVAAAITTGVILAADGIESGSERFDRSGPLVDSTSAIDERNRDAARLGGTDQGRREGRQQAEQDFANLSPSATQTEGYEFGFQLG